MSIVTWDEVYSVEIDEIDEQHKRLIEIMNELYQALANRSTPELIRNVLDRLVEYTRTHFAYEENLMRLSGYQGYAEHKAIHDEIVKKVRVFQARIHAGDPAVGMELLMFLKDWLFDHISREDRQYSKKLLRGNGLGWLKKLW